MVIEEFRNIRIAYMRRTGEYGIRNKELMETFKAYLIERNLLTADSIILGIAMDDPNSVDKSNLRYDVGLVRAGNEDIGLAVREIPDGKYAIFEISHTVEAVSEFWGNLPSLLGELPIDRSKPIIERYAVEKVANHLCEFCIPLISQQVSAQI